MNPGAALTQPDVQGIVEAGVFFHSILILRIEEVLGYDPNGIFVSDGSSLWDFSLSEDEGISRYQNQIEEIFGLDISHIESGNLVEISKYISDRSSSK